MKYLVRFRRSAWDAFHALPEKTQRIITDKLANLSTYPYPGSGGVERLRTPDVDVYRLHIGRSYTVLYLIHDDAEEQWIEITHLMTIEQAHKRYGRI